ncbi:LacI family DNA-binding transcriptional regulator [Clostridium sp. CM028]|uniref:LacI family DNA-binding transcriptional regulator n=1 Tax=unclassified Clostridium TaxID=2614128 RepID=UPI001C0AD77C|nr:MULTISPECIES: LacI family DNA-binding transcriptional regulator [unclassified Clostridium]MBU3092604.1 LacI family DNA-binding transcriptional regulator [Clostridium sp. CF011]MBW9146195.1 LacI family DNA-binding transcriptional regulator [Clostridium sp. CM027]MBW9149667.1 LacI family DNA-binding transcriptional regulator [Clostridium sp. CM028]UVE39825.1 LacI family DNA-binding transcriptional regulator [Clostridium sp. CM027]WAG68732.1 LacI family DNA-binding transcriptional regulator [C
MRKVIMKDIADKLNISINAVSLALNRKAGVSEETRKTVLDVAEQIGYLEKSTKFILSYASKNICVLIRKLYFEDNYFYSKIMMGIVEEARKNGYDIITCMIDENEENIPSCIEHKKVCGVVVIGAIDDDYLIKLKGYKAPVVLVDHTSLLESTDSILTDNKLGSFKITKLLLDRGYKKIGFFGELEYSLSVKERFFGYQEAMKKFINFKEENKMIDFINRYSVLDNLEEYVIRQDLEWVKEKIKCLKDMPEAFVCSNDNAAIILISSLKEMGYSIPQDIAVVGFDDIVLSSFVVPNITTVRVEKELMGRKALNKLLWRLDHKNELNENIIMSVSVIERDSVGVKE